jgi:hypothetical protein
MTKSTGTFAALSSKGASLCLMRLDSNDKAAVGSPQFRRLVLVTVSSSDLTTFSREVKDIKYHAPSYISNKFSGQNKVSTLAKFSDLSLY